MAYTKQTWADLPSKTTPINATRLGHIEDGIFNAAATADNAASTAGTAAANIGIVSSKVETLTGRVNDLDTAVSNKVDKVAGKGLSTNDYDNTDKGKVDSLGTASTKNSTSVVTESSDLVESGAVYTALQSKVDNSVIGTVEDGTTVQKSGGYAVGSHAIRNGAFITWKNAKAQGEPINDADDYTSGDVADELTPITKTFTPVSGITATDTKCYLYGKLKYLYLNVSGLTIAAETNTQIGSVSDDMKPASTIRTALINQDGDIIVSCSIFSNGNVWIKSKTALSNVTLIGSLMWI